jgi:hypothetical protein
MADVVYLHVGAPKTGTTFLQDRLYANRNTLAGHGVHYPVGIYDDMFPAALDLIDRRWGGQREDFRGQWGSLVGRVARTPGKVIISHEVLAGATTDQAARARNDLGSAELHIVYSARDIARQVPAEWQETVKHRNSRRFRSFVRTLQAAERRDSSQWFWRAQGLPDVMSRWASGLPPARVHVVTVPQHGAPRDELWHRYCRAFDFDPALAPHEGGRANSSLGIEETAMLRELNRRLKQAGLDSASYRRVVRDLVIHPILAERPPGRPVTLAPKDWPWAMEVAEEWIEWVQGAGVDVVGDVSDLRPVPAEEGTWQDPDRPKQRKVADAALDALVAMVLEQAERSAGDHAVTRIGRAARRLSGL